MTIAIAGYGIEGKASAEYWRKAGHDVTILDEKPVAFAPENVTVISRPNVFDDLGDYDMVVRTASLRPDRLGSAKKVWSATNEFFAECPAKIIGVTGTKGKGTTVSFIASILRAAGKKVHVVGNIGTPALEILPNIQPDDIVVFEMSSFQLWDLERSPASAVVLMIEPDHLDVHVDMAEYVAAKARIVSSQTADNQVIYHPANEISAQIAAQSAGQKIRYSRPEDGGAYVKENTFFVQSDAIGSVSTLQVVGQHNIENACAAISAAWLYTQDVAAIARGLHDFTGLPHRLKLVREQGGVRYYDDNYSSAPGAAMAAMRAFTEPEVLIMGGYDKKIDFMGLAQAIAAQPNIKHIILIGQTRHSLASALDTVGKADWYEISDETTLAPIVARARDIAVPGDVVIMSPACASFDMFANFSDRGDQFIRLVEGL